MLLLAHVCTLVLELAFWIIGLIGLAFIGVER